MKILVVNAGSSSLKYQLIDMTDEATLAKGLIERIGIPGSKHTYIVKGEKFITKVPIPDHIVSIKQMIAALLDSEHGVLQNVDEISAVGHRVVQGGEKFTESVMIDQDCLDAVEENIPLGPLHNPANLMGIKACQQVMPNTPMIAVFDTAFHQTMPPKAYLYGLPYEYYTRLKVRRYGFHGTSHRYVSDRGAKFIGKKKEDLRIITCHLGNGSSISAVAYGKCIDTSMGMTPLEGILMGTRSGNLDPAVLQFIMHNDHINIDEMLDILNKKSGLLGVSGISSDMRDVEQAAVDGNARAQIALDIQIQNIKKYIGAYAAVMGGVDMIIFTAGIGENGIELREHVMVNMEFLGVEFDKERNNVRGKEAEISTSGSKVKVLVIPTNEELVIAQDTMEILLKLNK